MITTTECANDQCDLNGSLKSNITLLTATTCPHCQTMKDIVSKQIANGSIQVVDEYSPHFDDLIIKDGVTGVPTFFKDEQVCDFTGTELDPKLTCDGEEVKL